jgi:hypothetical protein
LSAAKGSLCETKENQDKLLHGVMVGDVLC